MRKVFRIERLMIVISDEIEHRCCHWKWCNHGWKKRHLTMFYFWVGKYWINFHTLTLWDKNITALRHKIVREKLGIPDGNLNFWRGY